jgi:hypothetical protein
MTALSAAAGRALSRFGGQQLADRVAELAHLQRAEITLLNELQRDMDRLLAEPLLTAGRLLDDASRPHRSDEDRRRLLQEARASLTRALSLDSDPLRLSAASLLLAAVWVALDSPEDAPALVRDAHTHAVKAALALADAIRVPAAPPRRRLPMRLLLGGIPKVTWRRAIKDRPKSMRVSYQSTMSAFGRVLVEAEQYSATENAREDEQTLAQIDEYVRALRGMRVLLGDPEETIPRYRVRLTPSVSAATDTLFGTMRVVFHALTYEEVVENEPPPAATTLPSDEHQQLQVRLLPKGQ